MNYAIIPSLASGMLRNFTDSTLTLPFNTQHVAELHGLPNDGCQVPRSGQARVASQQTDDPRMELGYDTHATMMIWRFYAKLVMHAPMWTLKCQVFMVK